MQTKDSRTNRNGVSRVVEIGKGKTAGRITEAPIPPAARPAERIRQVSECVRVLLLEDETGVIAMVGPVVTELGRIDLELQQLAGQQSLYEAWVLDV